jgi:hypothetical protein
MTVKEVFDRLPGLHSLVVEDGHVTLVNGRGPAEYLGERHEPGVRPPSVERQAYEFACDFVARSPEDWAGKTRAFARDPRFTHQFHEVGVDHAD